MQFRSFVGPALIVLAGLLIGWLVLATTIDRIYSRRSPALALTWNPSSADANIYQAEALLRAGDVLAVRDQVASHADRSLRRQPINPGAARLLGLVAATAGDARRAEGLVRYAEAMSRRDLPTQLWLIEHNVARNDIPAVLRHYNRALKTSAKGRALLFPILIAAAEDRVIWEPLSNILARRPQWWREFVNQLIPKSQSPDALYVIARRTGIAEARPDPALLQGIEKRLVELRAYARAADLYNRAHRLPSGTGAPLRNGAFEQPTGFDPFEWNLRDEPDLSAVRQPSPVAGGGNALFLTAANGRGGDDLAVQLMILPRGRYAAGATIGSVAGDPLAFPHLIVRCAHDGRELLNARFPVAGEAGARWRGSFVVPSNCKGQQIALQANSSLDPSSMTPWIDNIVIQPQKGR